MFWRKSVREIRYNGLILMIFEVRGPSKKPVSSASDFSLSRTRNLTKKHTYCRHNFETEIQFFGVDAARIV